jgi:hypothetical protein
LLIRLPGTIMDMYTDWGNLKIVSCGAWLEGRTRQLNMCTVEWTHWGRPFDVNARSPGVRLRRRLQGSLVQLGDAGKFRYSSICF